MSTAKKKGQKPGHYEVDFLGHQQLPLEKRRDLESTNRAIADVISRGQLTPIHLEMSIYAIRGAPRVDKDKKKAKKDDKPPVSGKTIFELNAYNVLVSAAQGNCFGVLARDSDSGERDEGTHSVYVFLCKTPKEAEDLAGNLTQITKTLFESIKEVKRRAAEKLASKVNKAAAATGQDPEKMKQDIEAMAANDFSLDLIPEEGDSAVFSQEEMDEASKAFAAFSPFNSFRSSFSSMGSSVSSSSLPTFAAMQQQMQQQQHTSPSSFAAHFYPRSSSSSLPVYEVEDDETLRQRERAEREREERLERERLELEREDKQRRKEIERLEKERERLERERERLEREREKERERERERLEKERERERERLEKERERQERELEKQRKREEEQRKKLEASAAYASMASGATKPSEEFVRHVSKLIIKDGSVPVVRAPDENIKVLKAKRRSSAEYIPVFPR